MGFNYDPSLDIATGPPFIQVNGYTTIGDPITGPRNTYENAFDYSGSFSWVRGRHEFKFGGGYQNLQVNVLQGIATNGFFVFAGAPIVPDAFASFLFGQPVFFLQGRGDFSRGIRGHALSGYGQDTFKATSRLTFNLGLRYDLPFPYTEIHNRQTLWVPGRQSVVMPDAPEDLLYPGDPGVPGGLDPYFQKGLCTSHRSGLGSDGQLKVAGHGGLRNVLRALLHWTGGTAAVSHKRASVSADAAGELSPVRQSLWRTASSSRDLREPAYQSDAGPESAAALHAGLGLECPAGD